MKELKWVTMQQYVEKDTGEVLDRETVKQKYSIIKKTKHVQKTKIVNYQTQQTITKGIVTWTYECRKRTEQLTIW